MGIFLSKVRIENFRSIKNCDINLSNMNILFGMNDSGKSNFYHALRFALGNQMIENLDVYSSPLDPYTVDKKVVIDLKFIPVDENGSQIQKFDSGWFEFLGNNCSVDTLDKNHFFAFRTEFKFDVEKEEYVRERKVINFWHEEKIIINGILGYKTLSAFEFVYIDAQRDLSLDLRDRTSLWSKQVAKIDFPPEESKKIEKSLNDASKSIMDASPFLQLAQKELSNATNTNGSSVEINPITRSISDLYKGIDIYITQKDADAFPISNLGLGTRSRAVFSTIKTIINSKNASSKDIPYYCLLAIEEPESNLHPNSQKKLVNDFVDIKAQKLITTHSPYLLAASDLSNLVFTYMSKSETHFRQNFLNDLDEEQIRQVRRLIVETKGEILFSNIVVLAEGETEEQALSIYFETYFGDVQYSLNTSIIGVGGKNYYPYVKLLNSLGIKWFIFSDGEVEAISDVQKVLMKLYKLTDKPDLTKYGNIVVIDNSDDYEKHLVRSGYNNEIISAINSYENTDNKYVKLTFFDYYISQHNGQEISSVKTGVDCDKCGQPIRTKRYREYLSPEGQINALIDCMKNGKTKYAKVIADEIVKLDVSRRIPPKVTELFVAVAKEIGSKNEII